MKKNGFTLIEIVIAMGMVVLLSFAFLSTLQFVIKTHSISTERYDLVLQGEITMENVINDMKSYNQEEITWEKISEISAAHSDNPRYEVRITPTSRYDLYIGEIIFTESRYENLCTQIRIP